MYVRIVSLFCLVAMGFLFSCSDDEKKEDTDPNKPTDAYYIQFKANGVLKTFQTAQPGYQSCGSCACAYLPIAAADKANVSLCNVDNAWITAADIQAFKGGKFSFTSGFPFASFHYVEDGITYNSDYASVQTGSVQVSNVVADGNVWGVQLAFKVTGTFSCNVWAEETGDDIAITEGKFVVRYLED